MKYAQDKQTGDLLEGFIRQRGRPPTGKAMTAAERQQARRDRLREAAVGELTVQLPRELLDGLKVFVEFKDLSYSQVIERLVRQQLLRKR